MSLEKRGAPRKEIRWEGLIIDHAGSIVGRCVMTNVSVTGAKLAFTAPTDVPDSFVLLLSKNGEVRRQCTVVRRSEMDIRVRFVSSPSTGHEVISYLNDTLARLAPKTLDEN
jgi:hypothetical protein